MLLLNPLIIRRLGEPARLHNWTLYPSFGNAEGAYEGRNRSSVHVIIFSVRIIGNDQREAHWSSRCGEWNSPETVQFLHQRDLRNVEVVDTIDSSSRHLLGGRGRCIRKVCDFGRVATE